ncbi:peptidoglycan-recognition protein SD [Scaptodrosophila lebanonensis]|uniref:Peptidoglycan-recognition protein n=1 Tax=Drosophila lebanonensis TaxID=7225 RepID=A0A6J2TYI9_DROLE|nr:peptidoglycan-recognition protein SD [Scaptodrosophila lebanonensis]
MICERFLIYMVAGVVLGVANAEDLVVVKRSEWGARPATDDMRLLELPADRVVIAHTASTTCNDETSCKERVRNLQRFQMVTARFADIAYHYLIGNDGRVYEGRSATNQGAFAIGHNAGSLGIAFIGSFNENVPTDEALKAAQDLIAEAVRLGQLKEEYQLYGHRQLSPTVSPGDALYAVLQKWPHWQST